MMSTTSPPTETYLTRLEVAQRFRVSKQTVKNWADRKLLRSIQIGGTIRYPLSDVLAIEAQLTTEKL